MYYNAEHYPDPTAGEALANIEREERRRMTQKEFYHSTPWLRARDAYIKKRIAIDGGMCEECHNELGYIVHHEIWLNDTNCNDPSIALNDRYFKYDCLKCHNKEKDPNRKAAGRAEYGPNGEVYERNDSLS